MNRFDEARDYLPIGSRLDSTDSVSGRLELADHGTLFLDEMGDIPLELQPKLAAHRLRLEPAAGRYLWLSTASLSALSYEHNLCKSAIRLWNDTRRVGT